MRRSISSSLLAALAFLLMQGAAQAATCTADDFAAAVDKSGAALRAFNAEALPKLQDKLKQLKDKRGWDEEKALGNVRDDRTTKLDAEAEDLILKIDTLGRPPEKGPPDCSKLAELEAAGLELLAAMKAKSTYTLSKLDAELAGGGKEVASSGAKPPAKDAKPAAKPAATPEATPPPKPVAKSTAENWTTQTKPQPGVRDEVTTLEPGPHVAILEPLPPDESRLHHRRDPRDLARLLRHHLDRARQRHRICLLERRTPRRLRARHRGRRRLPRRPALRQRHALHARWRQREIYWHGPSIGTDFGASGSRTHVPDLPAAPARGALPRSSPASTARPTSSAASASRSSRAAR